MVGEYFSFCERLWACLLVLCGSIFAFITGNCRLISEVRSAPLNFVSRSTPFLMSIIFGGVILAMEKADTIRVEISRWRWVDKALVALVLGFALPFTREAAMVGWGILFALGRTGFIAGQTFRLGPTGRTTLRRIVIRSFSMRRSGT